MTLRASTASPQSGGVSQDELKPLDREAVARIIDPEAWEETHADDNDEAAAIFAEAWEDALSKADQIIGLRGDKSSVADSGGRASPKSDGSRKSEEQA